MKHLSLFTKAQKNKLVQKRARESKFGDHVHLITDSSHIYDQLLDLDVPYVLLGIPEDIGVFANYGKTGTSRGWNAALKYLLNMQGNRHSVPERLLILGNLDYRSQLTVLEGLNPKKNADIKKARAMVAEIDKDVTHIIAEIVRAGKTPIVVGGGHNNAYGILKGTSLALNQPINAVNLDTHADFRAEEGRHSGNGFSYAYSEGFLNKYFVFGLHENYTANYVFKRIKGLKTVDYSLFEDIEIRRTSKYRQELNRALDHVSSGPFGIEIDCDAIEDIPSSAKTPSGFSANRARNFLHVMANHKKARYLHICEGAPTKKTEAQVGKLLAYLISDFIKR